ncbi:MAG: hypothetical protein M4579_004154 [Chaenotheca gracillima]|nr:MAG: hypothetical protein M4579_004154 [Chaenotheca gracillima]
MDNLVLGLSSCSAKSGGFACAADSCICNRAARYTVYPREQSATSRTGESEPKSKHRRAIATVFEKLANTNAQHLRNSSGPEPPPISDVRAALRTWRTEHDEQAISGLVPRDPQDPSSDKVLRSTQYSSAKVREEEQSQAQEEDTEAAEAEDSETLLEGLSLQVSDNAALQGFLKPGDVFEMSGGVRELAVLVRLMDNEFQIYTESGKWSSRDSGAFSSVKFVMPGFFGPEHVKPLLSHIPDQPLVSDTAVNSQPAEVPRQVGGPILRKMANFKAKAMGFYQKHSSRLDAAHDILAYEKRPRKVALQDMVEILLGDSAEEEDPMIVKYAVHKALSIPDYGFIMDGQFHKTTQTFIVLPRTQMRQIRTLRNWAHSDKGAILRSSKKDGPEDMSPLTAFVVKAKALIKRSRALRSITSKSMMGPSTKGKGNKPSHGKGVDLYEPVPTGYDFSSNDKIVIGAMEQLSVQRNFKADSPLHSVGAFVLNATKAYDDLPLDTSTIFLFLQEIGVYSPWEKPHKIDAINLPTKHKDTAFGSLEDSMKEYRKDWKDLEVFCIDSEDTFEVDDGISLERIPGSNESLWVHIHVAHPSAFIPPEHELASKAASAYQTLYLPEQTIPMLPRKLTQSQLSLVSDGPALTFSAKIDEAGEISETNITPSIVRNIHYMTPGRLDAILTHRKESSPSVYTVGGEMPPKLSSDRVQTKKLSRSQIDDIQDLQETFDKLRVKRASRGAMNNYKAQQSLSVYKGPSTSASDSPSYEHSQFFKGDPIIQLREAREDIDALPRNNIAHGIVSEAMILAGEVAARWCKDRNIPAPFRGRIMNPDMTHLLKSRRDLIQSKMDDRGFVSLRTILGTSHVHETSILSPTAVPHVSMGLEHYLQATSPLRRYVDLLAHWQIDAALSQEARTGKSLVGSHDHSFLPFSEIQLSKLLPKISLQEIKTRLFARLSENFWTCQFFNRAHNFKEVKLPDTFEFCVRRTKPWGLTMGAYGWISMFSVPAMMSIPDWLSWRDLKAGDRFEVELQDVAIFPTMIRLKPLRAISRESAS